MGNSFADLIFDNMGWICIALIALAVVAMFADVSYKQKLMDQCMADGKKEYECRALIKQGDTTYIPIVIPVR